MSRSIAKNRYNGAKSRSNQRGIDFKLSFDQWYDWWLSNGVDKNKKQPPKTKDTLCMCRYGDIGPYELSNIYCATVSENVKDQWKNGHSVGASPKKIKTPLGIFNSKKEATAAYKVDRTTMARWLKSKADEFYYL